MEVDYLYIEASIFRSSYHVYVTLLPCLRYIAFAMNVHMYVVWALEHSVLNTALVCVCGIVVYASMLNMYNIQICGECTGTQ